MKKTGIIAVLLAIVLLCAVPSMAFAATAATSAGANMRLINPSAILTIGDNLFVADNIDSNRSVILCFDITGSTPIYKYTCSLNKSIVNIADVNGELCVIYADSVETYTVGESLEINESKKYDNTENIKDITYGIYAPASTTYNAVYFLDDRDLTVLYEGETTRKATGYQAGTTDAANCLFVSESMLGADLGGYVYCVFNNDIKRYNGKDGSWGMSKFAPDLFNENGVYAPNFSVEGIFAYQVGEAWQLALYSEKQIYTLEKKHHGTAEEGKEWEYGATEAFPLNRENADSAILDVQYAKNKLFILNSNKQVEIYSYDTGNGKFEREQTTIGTDTITVDSALPTKFTEFTLAKSKGYPTNIVYKTTDAATSIEEIITDNEDTFTILNFDGADELPFYYVLVGNKFGWVKKSDGVSVPQDDPMIEIINTQISPNISYKAKFISANAVTIYELPLSDSKSVTFNQTLADAKDVIVLQRFTEVTDNGKTIEWYFVSYDDGKKGFIQSGNIGQFYTDSTIDEGVPYLDDMKINSSIFEAVKIYLTSSMAENEAICDSEGNVIKLYSGALVKAIRTEKDATYVEVKRGHTVSYGWMPTNNLIGQHKITTNAIVGLSILGAAIIVAAVFFVVFVRRKKKKTESKTEKEEE